MNVKLFLFPLFFIKRKKNKNKQSAQFVLKNLANTIILKTILTRLSFNRAYPLTAVCFRFNWASFGNELVQNKILKLFLRAVIPKRKKMFETESPASPIQWDPSLVEFIVSVCTALYNIIYHPSDRDKKNNSQKNPPIICFFVCHTV